LENEIQDQDTDLIYIVSSVALVLLFYGLAGLFVGYSIYFFCFVCFAFSIIFARIRPFEPKTVDFLYYSLGVIGVMSFSFSQVQISQGLVLERQKN